MYETYANFVIAYYLKQYLKIKAINKKLNAVQYYIAYIQFAYL